MLLSNNLYTKFPKNFFKLSRPEYTSYNIDHFTSLACVELMHATMCSFATQIKWWLEPTHYDIITYDKVKTYGVQKRRKWAKKSSPLKKHLKWSYWRLQRKKTQKENFHFCTNNPLFYKFTSMYNLTMKRCLIYSNEQDKKISSTCVKIGPSVYYLEYLTTFFYTLPCFHPHIQG